MSKKLVIFSFFSGSGFLDLGFENNGFQVDLVNEFQPAFLKAYQYSRAAMGMRKPKYGYFNIDINEFSLWQTLMVLVPSSYWMQNIIVSSWNLTRFYVDSLVLAM